MVLYDSFVESIIETLAHAPWLFRYMTASMVLKIEVFTTKDAAKPYLTDEILDEIIVHKVRGNRYKDIRQDSHAFSIFVRDLYQIARSTYRYLRRKIFPCGRDGCCVRGIICRVLITI